MQRASKTRKMLKKPTHALKPQTKGKKLPYRGHGKKKSHCPGSKTAAKCPDEPRKTS